ncbi:short-chain dehydrogenase/reductase [Aspergillus sclerotioniger CBS 115572]|uniref:Short-chain dehydrogenase/reductase n=1 Tax=Aspergillus sclerotioniger CBS 115572 TaxID=1450535 RepID=A0A317XBZ5_9EURO|nr:short-chain dehydrogenase/reductase [Aspergillus sclerotioniger CBS 115572]PWY96116.1 short-chain dehydrogenase/reductase [Aspergillus sclerotioniger CBS 115572]
MLRVLHNQLFVTPSLPSTPTPFNHRTVIITGANTGLGLAAAHHIAAGPVGKLILAVRNTEAGETARDSLLSAHASLDPQTIEVWPLDLASYDSVRAFAARAISTLDRLDVLLSNAGLATFQYSKAEGHERTITVNVISTFLLAVLLLPKLRATGELSRNQPEPQPLPVLSIVASEVHAFAKFPERQAPEEKGVGIFEALDDPDQYYDTMGERYRTSKLLDILLARELADRVSGDQVVVNCLNPGLCRSQLSREMDTAAVRIILRLLGRTLEVGGRTLVAAAAAGKESHGQYMSNGELAPHELSSFVTSDEGKRTQQKLWEELTRMLDTIQPGVMYNVQ